MQYECQRCKMVQKRGCLPDLVGCSLIICPLIFMFWAVPVALTMTAIENLLLPPELGWWRLLTGPLNFLVSAVIVTLVGAGLAALHWAAFGLWKCPHCGVRDWAEGPGGGFGL